MVAGGLVITFCTVVLMYENILMNSRLGNSRLRTGLQSRIWGKVHGACPSPLPIRGPR